MDALTPAVEDRVRREPRVWITTLRADGSPHVTPVWFVYHPGLWWVGSDARNIKVGNLEHDPRVSLALEDGTSPVVAEGIARIHRVGFPEDIVEQFAGKYAGWDIRRQLRPNSPRVLIEIEQTRWLLTGAAQ